MKKFASSFIKCYNSLVTLWLKEQKNGKITAVYCRISREDNNKDDSYSIQNQKINSQRIAKNLGLKNIKYFIDDVIICLMFLFMDLVKMHQVGIRPNYY